MWDVYEMAGQRLAVQCGAEALRETIRERWAPFRRPAADAATSGARFHLAVSDDPGRLTAWQFFNNGRLLVIADDRRLVTGYLYREPWDFHVTAYRQPLDYVYYYLFEPLVRMALMRRGLVHWHSAAVVRHGRAVLIVGPSGSGKSTTVLEFVRAGFAFLADDEVFLRRDDEGVRAFGGDADLYVTDAAVSMFPELSGLQAPLVLRGDTAKRRIRVDEVFPGAARASGDGAGVPVAAVLFPSVRPGEPMTARLLSPPETVVRCLAVPPKEYPTLVTDTAAMSSLLDTYAALSQTARAYDVRLGREVSRLPLVIEAALA